MCFLYVFYPQYSQVPQQVNKVDCIVNVCMFIKELVRRCFEDMEMGVHPSYGGDRYRRDMRNDDREEDVIELDMDIETKVKDLLASDNMHGAQIENAFKYIEELKDQVFKWGKSHDAMLDTVSQLKQGFAMLAARIGCDTQHLDRSDEAQGYVLPAGGIPGAGVATAGGIRAVGLAKLGGMPGAGRSTARLLPSEEVATSGRILGTGVATSGMIPVAGVSTARFLSGAGVVKTGGIPGAGVATSGMIPGAGVSTAGFRTGAGVSAAGLLPGAGAAICSGIPGAEVARSGGILGAGVAIAGGIPVATASGIQGAGDASAGGISGVGVATAGLQPCAGVATACDNPGALVANEGGIASAEVATVGGSNGAANATAGFLQGAGVLAAKGMLVAGVAPALGKTATGVATPGGFLGAPNPTDPRDTLQGHRPSAMMGTNYDEAVSRAAAWQLRHTSTVPTATQEPVPNHAIVAAPWGVPNVAPSLTCSFTGLGAQSHRGPAASESMSRLQSKEVKPDIIKTQYTGVTRLSTSNTWTAKILLQWKTNSQATISSKFRSDVEAARAYAVGWHLVWGHNPSYKGKMIELSAGDIAKLKGCDARMCKLVIEEKFWHRWENWRPAWEECMVKLAAKERKNALKQAELQQVLASAEDRPSKKARPGDGLQNDAAGSSAGNGQEGMGTNV
ncbi:unnamed protein product [Closterium sp. NIES-64]|nr:unnamed protein product [Closterium sp. NIES-64]